jgi:hypothetical protein
MIMEVCHDTVRDARCGSPGSRCGLWNYFLINLISARGDKCTRAEAETIIRGY